jgi:hypothetical protein
MFETLFTYPDVLKRHRDGPLRAGYLAHPGGNMAGVGRHKWLHWLPRSCSK